MEGRFPKQDLVPQPAHSGITRHHKAAEAGDAAYGPCAQVPAKAAQLASIALNAECAAETTAGWGLSSS